MFENMSEEDKRNVGYLIGGSIGSLFEILAEMDHTSTQEAIDRWVESYIAEKIMEATGDDNA